MLGAQLPRIAVQHAFLQRQRGRVVALARQRLRQAERGDLRTEPVHLRFSHHKADVAEGRQRADLAVGNGDLMRAALRAHLHQLYRFARVRRVADGDNHIFRVH